MANGSVMLGAITLVVVADSFIARHFLKLAGRFEAGDNQASNIDPVNARKIATAMLIMGPLIWLVFALISFGLIPATGIEPIKL